MIGRLTGILLEKNPPQILLDVQGVGYELDVPMSTFYNLPALNEKVVLHTQLIVREDAHLLYGFLSNDERLAFRQLLKISGSLLQITRTILLRRTILQLRQTFFTDACTFICFSSTKSVLTYYLARNIIRPLVKSYGVSSTVTLSPGKIRI